MQMAVGGEGLYNFEIELLEDRSPVSKRGTASKISGSSLARAILVGKRDPVFSTDCPSDMLEIFKDYIPQFEGRRPAWWSESSHVAF